MKSKRVKQATFAFPNGWGGRRKGAGRKPNGERAGVPHRVRERLAARFPVQVTIRIVKGLPSLRNRRVYRVVQAALVAGSNRFGFRLNEFSVQSNHLHMICEAEDRRALSRGMKGLLIRVAKAVNKLWKRRGWLATRSSST